jgi:hypothetical protein
MQRDQISAPMDTDLPRSNPSDVSGFRRGVGEVLVLLGCYTVRVTVDCRNVYNHPRTRDVNIPEEQSPKLERSERTPPIPVTSALIL